MSTVLASPISRDVLGYSAHQANVSYDGYVVLFLVIPGLNSAAAGPAMLIGRMVQEAIERELSRQEILLSEPPTSRGVMAAMQKGTAARLKGLKPEPSPGLDHSGAHASGRRFADDVTRRLYSGSPLSFVRHEDQFYFGFYVSNFQAGEAAVAAEVKRLGFLELAQIGHYDAETKISATYHPKMSADPVTPLCVDVLKNAGILPQ